ncbi:protein kinase domain-containing protein [Blastococcus sp. SYSU D00820]
MDGESFGPYRLQGLIGRGGMGEVHRAYDTEHDRVVALKLLSPHLAADAGYRARFQREAQLTARLREPHVIPIHRFGEIDGRLFLDMRLVEGEDLATRIARAGPMPVETALTVAGQVAEALDAAHADGLVHRDVKPSNILLTGRADRPFVYLVDFGIARSADDPAVLTETGTAIGSLEYMAPERFVTGRDVDRRVDVYALACVLYECLTGVRAFPSNSLPTAYHAHCYTDPPPLWVRRRDVPPALDGALRQGLVKDPLHRIGSAGALVEATRQALLPPPVPQGPPARRPPSAATRVDLPPPVAVPVPAGQSPAGQPPAAPYARRPTPPAGYAVAARPVPVQPVPVQRPPTRLQPVPGQPMPLAGQRPAAAPGPMPGQRPAPPPAPWAGPPPQQPPRARRHGVLGHLVAAVAAVLLVVLVAAGDDLDVAYGTALPLGFGLTAAASTAAIGLTLGLRDLVDRAGGFWWVLGAIAAGTLALWALRPEAGADPLLAFAGAQAADLVVWQLLRRAAGWRFALWASNAVGAVVLVELQLARGAPDAVWGDAVVIGYVTVATWLVAEVGAAVLALVRPRR